MPAVARHVQTIADYLAAEATSDQRHEFIDGEILAMAGGTLQHARLIMNVTALILRGLNGKPCQPYGSDARIRAGGLITYPDLSVVCGELERDDEDADAIVNPTMVVEVLSPSTAAWDRGHKFEAYATLPSLREYVLVDYELPRIVVYRRAPQGVWERRQYDSGARAELQSLGLGLSVVEVFEGWVP